VHRPAQLEYPLPGLLPDPFHRNQFFERSIDNSLDRTEMSKQQPGILSINLRESRDDIFLTGPASFPKGFIANV
jgi:hypothetical protein